jgi:hypothetical protein
VLRLVGLVALGGAALLTIPSNCFTGPYGDLSPELKEIWLSTVTEAQPFYVFAAREPVGALGSLGPLLVALAVALNHLRSAEKRAAWMLPAALLVAAAALSFYQIRTLPFACAIAIPILGVWLAEMRAFGIARFKHPARRAFPVAGAFLLAIPVTYLLVGFQAVDALAYVSDGRIAPAAKVEPPEELVAGLNNAEKNCFDPMSAEVFSEVPRGLVMAPLFYGPTVLKLSAHEVVAGPYHRNGAAILDAIHATHRAPAAAKAIIDARGVDYVAICAVSRESAIAMDKAPDGLLATLLKGQTPAWLAPVDAKEQSGLRLRRVVKTSAP